MSIQNKDSWNLIQFSTLIYLGSTKHRLFTSLENIIATVILAQNYVQYVCFQIPLGSYLFEYK